MECFRRVKICQNKVDINALSRITGIRCCPTSVSPKSHPPLDLAMKTPVTVISSIAFFCSLTVLVSAQSTAGADNSPSRDADETVTLSPFVVSEEEEGAWVATDTLMANRTRQALKDVPFSIEAITSDFIQDLDLATAEDVGRFVAGVQADFQMENDNDAESFSFRGIRSAGGTAATNPSRNYFRSPIPSDTYNVERMDFGKGSNSLVFGDTDPGGQAAVSTKRATVRNFGTAHFQYGTAGAYRAQVDINQKITNRLAIRLNLVDREQKTFQDFSTYALKAGHLALTWRPFKNTEVRLEADRGKYENNRGRTGLQVREVSARSLGFTTGFWYYTSDGTIINATTLPAADRSAANGPAGAAVTLLEGQYYDVIQRNASGATVGTKRIHGLPMNANTRGTFDLFARPYNTHSIFIEQRIGKLDLELAYNFQNQNADRNDGSFAAATSVDVNGRPYMDVNSINRKFIGDEIHSFRLLAALPWQPFKWMKQQLVASADYRVWSHDQYRIRLMNYAGIDNGTQTVLRNSEQIRYRAYLDDPLFYSAKFFEQFLPENLPTTPLFRPGWWSYDNSDTYHEESWAVALSATGSYFKGRIQTVLGIRHDDNVRYTYVGRHPDEVGQQLPPKRYKDAEPGDYISIPNLDYGHDSGSAGVTVALNKNVSLYGVWSTSFKAQDAITFDNQILGPITGLSKEIGVKGEFFNRRMAFSLGVFDLARENAAYGWSPNNVSAALLEDLFNPNGLSSSDPSYRTFQSSPVNVVRSTESSRGFDVTTHFRPLTGLQIRLTLAKVGLKTTPDFGTFRALLDEAKARGDENPGLISDAQLILDSNDLAGKPIGPRGSPWSGSWVIDYSFARESLPLLRGVRLGINGVWRQDYLLGVRDSVEYRGGATHIVGAYVMRNQKIWGRDVRLRVGARNLFDLKNGDTPRRTGIVNKLDGTVDYTYSYIMPEQYDVSLTVRF